MRNRRTDPPPGKLSGKLPAPVEPTGAAAVRDPRTGFYTLPAMNEFVQYEIDGGHQTEAHERFVSPVCIAAIGIDALPALPDDGARGQLVEVVAEAVRKMTRQSDRLARSGNDILALLRRTLAVRARDNYGPHLRDWVATAAGKAGQPTSVSIGISSLTEHLVKGPQDMVDKALIALGEARKRGPGSIVVYDFRVMPY